MSGRLVVVEEVRQEAEEEEETGEGDSQEDTLGVGQTQRQHEDAGPGLGQTKRQHEDAGPRRGQEERQNDGHGLEEEQEEHKRQRQAKRERDQGHRHIQEKQQERQASGRGPEEQEKGEEDRQEEKLEGQEGRKAQRREHTRRQGGRHEQEHGQEHGQGGGQEQSQEQKQNEEEDGEETSDGGSEGSGGGSEASAAAGTVTTIGEDRTRNRGGNSVCNYDAFRSTRSSNLFNSDILTQNPRDTYPPRSARKSVSRMLSLDNGTGVGLSRQGSEAGTSPTCLSVNYNLRGRPTQHSTLELDKDREVYVLPDLALCLEKLLRYKLVVITGPPGQGSKTLAYALCRAMQRKFKRDKIKVTVSNSWNEWDVDGDHEKAQIVLINNMFGSFEVTYVEDWCKIFAEMRMCIRKSDKLYHIITCKSNILEEVFPKINGKLFTDDNIFRITTSYTEDEKKQFISNHANRAHLELSQTEIDQIVQVADDFGFPKCCQVLLKRGTNTSLLPMRFEHPTEVYMEDLVNVPRTVFAMLLLLMLERPRSTCLDSTTRELTEVENTLLAAVGIQQGILVSHLIIDARMFQGVYIVEDKDSKTVDFRSDNILYSVVKLFYIRHAEFILKHCKFDLLDRMVRVGAPATPITVQMTPDQFVFFSDRCLRMLFAHEDLMNICLHPAFLSEDFIDAFFERAGDNLENLFHLKDRVRGQTWLYWSIWSKSGSLCRKTLSRMLSIGFKDHTVSKRGSLSNVEETIVASCVSRNTGGLSALIRCSYNSTKFNTTQYDTGLLPKPGTEESKCLVSCDTILEAACRYGSSEILDILIKERSRIANQADFTALFKKCVHYNMNDALQVLLTQLTEDIWVKDELQGCLNREFDWDEGVRLPPLHYAITKKFQDIARTLLQNGSETESLGADLTAAQTAWEIGNIEMFDHLIGCQAHFDFQDSSGRTPLEVAFKQKKRDLFMKMLSEKPTVNFAEETGEPILQACQTGDLEMAQRLVECGINLNVFDSMERTPLHLAALREDAKLITLLCTNRNIDVNAKDSDGSTALHLACDTIKPTFPHITELLKFEPQIDVTNDRLETSLHIAWKRSNIPLVQELIDHGADCNLPDVHGNELIHFAAEIGNIDLLKILLDHDANVGSLNRCNQTPLHIACKMQNYEVLIELLKPLRAIAHINAEDDNSFTPLHVACNLGNIYMAMFLITKGANINAGEGVSPVQIAWEKGNQMLFRKLVRLGGYVNSQHPESKSTPLHDACETDDGDMVKFLLDNGADVSIKDAQNQTPLHICCKSANLTLAEKVLNSGNITQSDIHGKTALYRACETGSIRLVQLLAEKRAPISTVDWTNHPLLAVFDQENYESLIAVLKNYGYNINALNSNGESILFYFCQEGRSDIVRKLLSCGAHPTNYLVQSKSPFYAAVFYEEAAMFQMLLEHGGEGVIDKLDRYGDSLLHVTCSSGKLDAVKRVLTHGASVNLKNKDKTQLHLICKRYSTVKEDNHIGVSLLTEFLKKGADVNVVTEVGSTPLHILSEGNNIELLNTLLSYRPNVNMRNNEGLMPFHVFLRSYTGFDQNTTDNNILFLRALLDAEADVDALIPDGLSPVHMVVKERRTRFLQVLLQYNPNLETTDQNGDMAIHVACRLKYAEMVAILLDHQCHVTALDARGRYPLHVACDEEAVEVLQVILEKGAEAELQTVEDSRRIPMDIAVAKNHVAMAETLLEYSDTSDSRVVELYRTCGHKDLRHTMWRAGVRTKKQIVRWCLLAVLKLIYVFFLMFMFVFALHYRDLGMLYSDTNSPLPDV